MDPRDDAATGLAIKGEMHYNPGECIFQINIFENHVNQCQEGKTST